MVRKASRLPPNTKSLEEVLLNRIVHGEEQVSTRTSSNETQRRSDSGAQPTTAPAKRTGTARKMSTTQQARPSTLAAPGTRRNAGFSLTGEPPNPTAGVVSETGTPNASSSATASSAGAASMDCMRRMAGEVGALDNRIRSLATRQSLSSPSSSSSSATASGKTRMGGGEHESERSYHQQEIEKYLNQSMHEIYEAHGSANRSAKKANDNGVHPTTGAHVTHAVRELRSTVRRLDRVFYEVASGDKQRQIAATKIAMLCRTFVVRRRFQKFGNALSAWRTRKCSLLVMYVEHFSAREEFINRQIAAMHQERTRSLLRKVLAEIRDVVLMNLPLRMRRLEETDRKFQLLQRTLSKGVFTAWKNVSLGPRSRKKVAADSKKRHLEARQRLEALERFELITTEMVHDEFLKANIRTIRRKHHLFVLRMYFRLLYALEFAPMKQKMLRAMAHDRAKRLGKVWGEWLPLFRAVQVDKAIARVSERRTLDRFDRHHNLRKIDAHYRRTHLLKHVRAWAHYGQRIRRVRKLFEDNTKENLVRLMHKWRLRAQYQHVLRDNVIEEWRAYSRRIFQTPFRWWYVYASQKRRNRVAKETICVAYERRQRRHTKYNFFRLWKHQVLFGNVEGVHSKLHLLRSLEDQKRMCLGLEVHANIYQEHIAALQASIEEMETKLAEKQQELEQLHDSTQVIRFGMHNAEQNIARVQGMLEAVRHIHPGTVERIEKMYKENPLLSKDLADVLQLHVSKRKELMAKIDLDETELEVHNAASASSSMGTGGTGKQENGRLNQDDQLLLHRVKWVLSRLDLQTFATGTGKEDDSGNRSAHAGSSMVPVEKLNQLCALFEFIRNGDTTVLTPENNPIISDRHRMRVSPLSSGGEVVHRHDLFEANETWHAFLQALTIKFVPERMLSVKERLVKRAAERDEEIAEIKDNPHIYNVYSGAAQVVGSRAKQKEKP